MSVPPFTELMNPVLAALRALGDSAALTELEEKAGEISGLPEDVLAAPHIRNRGTVNERITPTSEFAYRVRWVLTYLKKVGLVSNSVRGVWAFTDLGRATTVVDPRDVIAAARATDAAAEADDVLMPIEDADTGNLGEPPSWEAELLDILGNLEPSAFERLAQRLLREAGFSDVTVTGRSGDGGIDGRGMLKLNDLVSFHAVFQCKRYSSNVGPSEIREFRGAFSGRADRGIFITTAGFTPSAVAEAARDGVTPIDLVDGERLTGLLRRFQLGLIVEQVEVVRIKRDWFATL